jgi:hypothetical protein
MDWVYRKAEIVLRGLSEGELLCLAILVFVDVLAAFLFYREFKKGVVDTRYGKYTRDGQAGVFWTITLVRCLIVAFFATMAFALWRKGP